MSTRTQNPSILMLPWLAHGHISPFLELARKLSHRDFHIYFCSTPINLKPVRDTLLAQDSVSSIQLTDLHLPSDDFPQLPPHYHTTTDLPPHLMSTLKSAFDSAKSSFFDILRSLKPDLIVFDYLQPWASVAASELNIKAVVFLTMGAASCSFFTHSAHHTFNEYPFSALTLPDSENHRIAHLMNSSANGYKNKERFCECMERSSNIVLIKTSRVTEGKYVDYLSELVKKKVVTVGPLLQESANKDGDGEKIMEWLNKRQFSSVVLVSFGSEYFLSEEEREEIAYGLELSNVSFIWVLRFHGGEEVTIHEALPQKFLQRIGDRGLFVEGWAPQAKILGHPSIGGFVSHCGWSSTLEAILFGVPIIAMPMQLDQPLNAKLAVEIGVGMEVNKGSEGFRREEVARVIQQVVVEDKGKEVKRNAQELGKRMRENQKEEMDDVVEKLKQLIGV